MSVLPFFLGGLLRQAFRKIGINLSKALENKLTENIRDNTINGEMHTSFHDLVVCRSFFII